MTQGRIRKAGRRAHLITAIVVCCGALALPAAALAVPSREIINPPSGQSKGIIVLIHGGGWAGGQIYVTGTRPMAERLATSGFTVWNVDHANGAASLADVKYWYELAYEEADGKPVCTAGQSSGGHLALMLAGLYPTVSCVLAEAAPTDLETLTPAGVQASAQVWGAGNLKANSPVYHLPSPSTEVFLAASDADTVVPSSQATEYKAARPKNTSVLTMAPGWETYFVHSYTTLGATAQLNTAEQAVLARAKPITDDDGGPGPGDGGSGNDAADLLWVGEPIEDSKKGVARIPVEASVSGRLHLSGNGIRASTKEVEAGQRVTMKARPKGALASKLRREGRAGTQADISLTGTGKPATESRKIKFRRR